MTEKKDEDNAKPKTTVPKTEENKQVKKPSPKKIEFTTEQWSIIQKYAGFNKSIRGAAEAAGVSYKTIQRRLNEDGKSWNDYKDECKEKLGFWIADKILWKGLKEGDMRALNMLAKNIIGWSDNPAPAEQYDERPPATYKIIQKPTREEKAKIIETQKVERKEAKDETLGKGDNRKE